MEREISRLELTPMQRQVFEALNDKQPNGHSLGKWYLGTIFALQNKHNPERYVHAAHSMRELLEKLPRVMSDGDAITRHDFKGMRRNIYSRWKKDEEQYDKEWKGKEIDNHFDKTLRSVGRYLELNQMPTRQEQIQTAYESSDPMAHVFDHAIQKEKRDRFYSMWRQFEEFAHHNTLSDEKRFTECLHVTEQVILDFFAPITAPNQQEIKKALEIPTPSREEMISALALVKSRGANYDFFFKYASNSCWLPILKEQGFFRNPPDVEPDGEGGVIALLWRPILYLQRVASSAPDQVVDILVNLPKTDNPRILHRICEVAGKIENDELSLKFKSLVIRYVNSPYDWLIHQVITGLLNRWGEGSDKTRAAALDVLKAVIRFHPDPESEAKKELRTEILEKGELGLENLWKTDLKPSPHFEEWDYLQIMENGARPLADREPFQVAKLLASTATRMICLSCHEGDVEDVSWVRLDQVDENLPDFNATLIHALTYACESVYRNAPDSIEDLDRVLRRRPWKFFKRLRQHLYAKNPSDQTLPWIREFILEHTDYDGVSYDYEFQLMLRKACEHFGSSLLTKEDRIKIFDKMLSGPPSATYLTVTGFTGAQFTEEESEQWQRYHYRLKLRPFADLLFGRYQEYYQELEVEFTENPLTDEDYLPYRVRPGGLVSYVSPQSFEMLGTKEDEDLLTYINHWEDEHEDNEDWLRRITIRGLADEFQRLFGSAICHQAERLDFWIVNRDRIERPVYVKAIVQAFQASAKEQQFEGVDKWFEFCEWVLSHPDKKCEDGELCHEDSREFPDWGPARRAVMEFVGTCLGKDVDFPISTRDSLFKLLALLCNQSDWRLDHDKPFFKDSDNHINEALNNIRSRALLHLVDFGIWVQGHDSDDRLHDLTSVLENRFRADTEFPLTVPERALLGWQYGNLFALNQAWAAAHKEDFFPQEDLPVWAVAFGSFLTNYSACIPYYEVLKEDYVFAIDHLGELEGVKFLGNESADSLGQHLFDYYAWSVYSLNGEDSLLERFYSKTTDDRERWTNLFNHVGRSLSSTKRQLEEDLKDRVIAFFNWRSEEGESEELRQFGFWLKAECLEPDWRLDALMKLLNLGQWQEAKFFFFKDSLEGMLESHEAKVVECFARMTEILPHGDLYPKSTVNAIIVAGLNSEDDSVYKDAERARENLLRGGEFDLSHFEG